tara:strand:- start:40 stop:2214 length:2175 start_codon:yes stop_codon:yes gene_type:complete
MSGLTNLKTIFHEGPDGTLKGQQTEGVNFIKNLYAKGFATLQEQGATSQFEGIEGTTYMNPGLHGTLGFTDNIPDRHGIGFMPGLAAGDTTLLINADSVPYKNTGMMGFGGGLDTHPINYIPNTDANGFVEGKQHYGPSDFINVKDTAYETTSELGAIEYNSAGIGIDYIPNIYATGFTKLRNHSDPSEFTMVGLEGEVEDLMIQDGGTTFNRLDSLGKTFPFGDNAESNRYLPVAGIINKSSEIDPDNVMLIQQGGKRSVGNSGTFLGKEVTAVTLEDYYNSHIDDLIDFEQAKGKTDDRLDPRWQSPTISNIGGGGYFPLTFDRGNEPYIVSPIGESKNILNTAIDDGFRMAKYLLTADGIKFMAFQNVAGIGSYVYHRTQKHGTSNSGKADRYGVATGVFGPPQQFQYTYNPLSVFSSAIPLIKIRLNRSFLFDETTYLDRETGLIFGIDLTPNKNNKIATTIPDFKNQGSDDKKGPYSTLGGFVNKNVNESIDGKPMTSQGIIGDRMTRSPIDTKENINKAVSIHPDGNLESMENGYPFYFKDLRNDKLLVFRGYIEDMNENVQPNWNSEVYVGRSEPVYTYSNTSRDISFTLKLYPNNYDEYKMVYEKLDYLTSMCYPEYFQDNVIGYTRPKPPLARMRLADLYGSTSINDTIGLRDGILGFINSVNYVFEAPWDQFVEGERAPRNISVTIGWTVLHDSTPNMKTQFYGVTDAAAPGAR